MTFYVENETDFDFGFDTEELLGKLVKHTVECLKLPYSDFAINLSFTDDEAIHEINRQFREIDRSTDVLSFPAIDFESPMDFSCIEGREYEYFDPDTDELILGDIMISVEHVTAQAREYNHSILRETAFLITHSLLHLLGFDHMQDDERIEMEARQNDILNAANITRETV